MGEFSGTTVLITGAARGQGRAHALRFAEEGANLILLDSCCDLSAVPYPLASPADLLETERAVVERGVQAVTAVADVRSWDQVHAAMAECSEKLGTPTVVVANAGVFTHAVKVWEIDPDDFRTAVDVNLTGVWHIIRAAMPAMIERGKGGSVIATVSTAGLRPTQNVSGYAAAKHAVHGLVRSAALELGPHGIRANCVSPGSTNTPLFRNDAMRSLFVPDQDDPSDDEFLARSAQLAPLGNAYVEPEDITEAVVWLASSAARFVTGANIAVDGGSSIR